MSEYKYTPGPWEWDSKVWDYDPEQDAPWLVTCEHAMVPDAPILTGQINCGSEANARLIAAAPDMLDALMYLFRAFVTPFPSEQEGRAAQDAWGEMQGAAKEAAIAAIAKATALSPATKEST